MKTLTEKYRLEFNTIARIRNYFNDRTTELRKLANDKNHENPCVFMSVSAIFDLLSYLPYDDVQMNKWKNKYGNDIVSKRYKQFLKDYVFDGIQSQFRVPLNELFYKRVRCGLALVWIGGSCIYCGYNSNVHFEMKNADGKVITKDVKPFEYMHDGNCFSFANDDNRYCGWEINYKYE